MATQEQLELRKRWIEALRSGKYEQGRSWLRQNDKFCCLGVACDVYNPNEWENDGSDERRFLSEPAVLPQAVIDAFGLKSPKARIDNPDEDFPITLTVANDSHDWSFAQIADFLEQHPEQVFID